MGWFIDIVSTFWVVKDNQIMKGWCLVLEGNLGEVGTMIL
jgi:hypothetical protein